MTNGKDPAFTGPTENGFTQGLSKREYFAAMAMQAMISNPYYDDFHWDKIANSAVLQADALIEGLNNK